MWNVCKYVKVNNVHMKISKENALFNIISSHLVNPISYAYRQDYFFSDFLLLFLFLFFPARRTYHLLLGMTDTGLFCKGGAETEVLEMDLFKKTPKTTKNGRNQQARYTEKG